MKWQVEDMRAKVFFNHLTYRQRTLIFMKTKKRRFLLIFLFVVTFNFIGNFFGFFLARAERSSRKYKKQWILKNNPGVLTYQYALDTQYEPMKISVTN